jgi:molecular chaperone DnaK
MGRAVIRRHNPSRFAGVVDRLTAASHKLAEAMYKSSAQPAGGAPPSGDGAAAAGEGKKDDNVVDAEFVDVDDKK